MEEETQEESSMLIPVWNESECEGENEQHLIAANALGEWFLANRVEWF